MDKTLDGRRTTAWNSQGRRAELVLRYTFERPVHLGRISVVNGWVHRTRANGDLYQLNQRVAEFTVATDQRTETWRLEDVRPDFRRS